MRTQDSADLTLDDISVYFAHGYRPGFGHANNVAELVLERLPNGEHAWLRPSTEPAEDDEARHWPTPRGTDQVARWQAERAVFNREVS